MLLWTSQDALDRGYYLSVAAILAGLVAEQVLEQRRLHAGLAAERERGDTLEERLAAAEATGDSIISFPDGPNIHRVPEPDIVRITAADDFRELVLAGRSPLLVGGTLKALSASLPDRFLRVHKSHVVNLKHVTAVQPLPLAATRSCMPTGRRLRSVGPIATAWSPGYGNGG